MTKVEEWPRAAGSEPRRSIAVAVTTFRRPGGLKRLLESVALMEPPSGEWTLDAVIVVDNDPNRSANATAQSSAAQVTYICEAEPGIAAARNTAVASARSVGASWIAFVDDDETVTSSWLGELTDVADRSGAPAVVGAVRFHHPRDTPDWFIGLRVFEDQLVDGPQKGEYFSTNNLLLQIDPWPVEPPLFDMRFGLTGGSDHHLGARLRAAGAAISYAPRAFADEIVLPERVNRNGAFRRLLRNGNALVRVELAIAREQGTSELLVRLRACLQGIARIGLGVIRALLGVRRGTRGMAGGIRTVTIGLGQLTAAAGRIVEEYAREEASS